MKTTTKFVGIIALIAIIGFVMISCDLFGPDDCTHTWEVTQEATLQEDGLETCSSCADTRPLVHAPLPSELIGTWRHAGQNQDITISATANTFTIINPPATVRFAFTIHQWNFETNTTGNQDTFAYGFKLTGETSTTTDNFPATNSFSVYMNVNDDRFVIKWQTQANTGTFEFVKQQ
jgi:hypothetical protein